MPCRAMDSQMTSHSAIRCIRLWILQNLHRPLSLELLAECVNLSSRNVRRVFQRHPKLTPRRYRERSRAQ